MYKLYMYKKREKRVAVGVLTDTNLLQGAGAVGVGQPQDPPTLGGWWPHFDPELALGLVQSTGGHMV